MEPLGVAQPPWATITLDGLVKVCHAIEFSPKMEEMVANMLQLKSYKFDLAEACVVDFFITVIWWCREQQFSVDQAGLVVDAARQQLVDIKVKNASVADSIRDLKMAAADLANKAISGLPSIPLEKLEEYVKFMSNIIIQHHKLWEFFFHRLHDETVICKQFVVETAPSASVPWPPPLFEGCPESLYKTYINPSISTSTTTTRPTTTAPPPDRAPSQVSTAPSTNATPAPPKTASQESSATPAITPKPPAQPKTPASHTPAPSKVAAPVEPDRHVEMASEKALEVLDLQTIRHIIENTSRELAQQAELEILSKIRERENNLLTKINQVHKTTD